MMSFYDGVAAHGDRLALVDGEARLTYQKLAQDAGRIGRAVESRSLVFCVCRNTVEAAVGYVGFLGARAVPTLLSDGLNRRLFEGIVAAYRPQYIWAPAGFYSGEEVLSYRGYRLARTPYAQPPAMDSSLALLLTTSGSTGSPKFVRQSYQNIDANTASIVDYLGIVPEDRAITTLPMSYTYGLSILQSHLAAGATVLLTESGLMEKAFWEFLRKEGATTFGGVPYTYEMLKRLRFLEMELPSLRYLTQAGGKLGREMHLEFAEGLQKKGVDFVVMYGQTEATARMSYVPAARSVEKAGTIGIAIPGGSFALMGVNDETITAPGVTGELVYRGDNVTLGYADRPEDLEKGDERGGVLHTGDMAQVDADGYYTIVGRKKRFLKVYGNRVNLDEVEGLLKKEGYEAACAGEDDHLRVYITNGKVQAVQAFLSSLTGLNDAAFEVRVIAAIPRSEAGKVLYAALEGQEGQQ